MAYCISDDLLAKRLLEVLSQYQVSERPMFVLYPHRRQLPTKVRVLIDFIAGVLADPVGTCILSTSQGGRTDRVLIPIAGRPCCRYIAKEDFKVVGVLGRGGGVRSYKEFMCVRKRIKPTVQNRPKVLCNTEAMNSHLAEIADAVAPGAHAVLIVDQAGWLRR